MGTQLSRQSCPAANPIPKYARNHLLKLLQGWLDLLARGNIVLNLLDKWCKRDSSGVGLAFLERWSNGGFVSTGTRKVVDRHTRLKLLTLLYWG